mmetsp:Transcript_11539/g.20732  ORF Transcript_11539/g.20732 Transcript_11539/m.20732 type:complete len:91 (+) Transcript_11539:640-912(+)
MPSKLRCRLSKKNGQEEKLRRTRGQRDRSSFQQKQKLVKQRHGTEAGTTELEERNSQQPTILPSVGNSPPMQALGLSPASVQEFIPRGRH